MAAKVENFQHTMVLRTNLKEACLAFSEMKNEMKKLNHKYDYQATVKKIVDLLEIDNPEYCHAPTRRYKFDYFVDLGIISNHKEGGLMRRIFLQIYPAMEAFDSCFEEKRHDIEKRQKKDSVKSILGKKMPKVLADRCITFVE